AEGRAALWRGDAEAAVKALARAARGHRRPALARAYLSLARRRDEDFDGAQTEADAAVDLDASCLEAHAARAAALLSRKHLADACLAYRQVTKTAPHDRDGHALRLLMVALFAETIAAATEDADGVRLDFKLTPATRCAIRTLDGRARQALDETARADNSTVVEIALGAAYYFADFAASRAEWGRAAAAFPEDGGNAAIRESLLTMSKEA
ncbi:MAG: hypothetical protein HY079_12455, partial [Elusimicrobia bacterium]|nr:hypothetical protein [Elusimicrobiota bacterium]